MLAKNVPKKNPGNTTMHFILKYSAVSVVAILSEQKKTCFLLPWEVDISAQKMARLLGLLLQGYLQE